MKTHSPSFPTVLFGLRYKGRSEDEDRAYGSIDIRVSDMLVDVTQLPLSKAQVPGVTYVGLNPVEDPRWLSLCHT